MLNYNKEKLEALPDEVLNKFTKGSRVSGEGCEGIHCDSDNCPFRNYCGIDDRIDDEHMPIIEAEKQRRLLNRPLTDTQVYKHFLSKIDLTKLGGTRKIALIKVLREFSNGLHEHSANPYMRLQLSEARKLVETYFTEEQLKPKTKCFDPTQWKRGDLIRVKDKSQSTYNDRIFLTHIEGTNDPFICVVRYGEDDFSLGNSFSTTTWQEAYKELK